MNVNRYSIRENNFAIFIIAPPLNGGRFLKKKILINEIFFPAKGTHFLLEGIDLQGSK